MDAVSTATWIESYTAQPHEGQSLCTYLRDGRVLCMLANALSGSAQVRVRSPDRYRTYHALESVSLFLRWARDVAKIGDTLLFTSAQLIDEQDEVAVLACLDALAKKYANQTPVKPSTNTIPVVIPSSTKLTPLTLGNECDTIETTKSPVKPIVPKRNVSPKSNQVVTEQFKPVNTDTSTSTSTVPPTVATVPPQQPSSDIQYENVNRSIPSAPVSIPSPPLSTLKPAKIPSPPLSKKPSKLASFLAVAPSNEPVVPTIDTPPFKQVSTPETSPGKPSTELPAKNSFRPDTSQAKAPESPPASKDAKSVSPLRQRNIASAYLAAIDSDKVEPSQSVSTITSPAPKASIASAYMAALGTTAAIPVAPSSEVVDSDEVFPTPIPSTQQSGGITLTIPCLASSEFSFKWVAATKSIELIHHDAAFWSHLRLVSINGDAVQSGDSKAQWRVRLSQSGPYICFFERIL